MGGVAFNNADYSILEKNGKRFQMFNNRYLLAEQLGRPGGFGVVYKVFDKNEKTYKAIKFLFRPTTVKQGIVENLIEQNVRNIMTIQNQTNGRFGTNDSIVRVYDVFRLPNSNGLAYVMELVDCDSLIQMKDVHNGTVELDAEQKCKVALGLAKVFFGIHIRGYAYKDINENNIYFGKDGTIKVIDVDNIAYRGANTVGGTPGYMAPEIYAGEAPNPYTDLMSLAIYYYRLLMGERHFPYDGKWTEAFFYDNEEYISEWEMKNKTNGRKAVFVFDPFDKSNDIRNVKNSNNPGKVEAWKRCAKSWDSLPLVIREAFVKTFSEGRNQEYVGKRMSDQDWKLVFEYVEKNAILTCPGCRTKIFNNGAGTITCKCGKRINNPNPPAEDLPAIVLSAAPQTAPTGVIVMDAISIINGKRVVLDDIRIPYVQDHILNGDEVFLEYGRSPLFQLKYSVNKNEYAIVNRSNYTWTCIRKWANTGITIGPGIHCVLRTGMSFIIGDQKHNHILVVKNIL